MPKFQKIRQNPSRIAKFKRMGLCFCCAYSDKPKIVRVLSHPRKAGKKAGKGGGATGGRLGTSNPQGEVRSQSSPQTQETESHGQRPQRCHQHSSLGCRSTHSEPRSISPEPEKPARTDECEEHDRLLEFEEPDRLSELEELTGLADLKELPSFADVEELTDTLEPPECPSWDQLQEPTTGTGEEWWEVLFEGIGIFPLVQPPYDEEHSYVMAPVSGETPGGCQIC